MTEQEKEIMILKFRRTDSWRFADYLFWRYLVESAEKENTQKE